MALDYTFIILDAWTSILEQTVHQMALIKRVFTRLAMWIKEVETQRSFAMYLEPWHADIEDFMELRKNHGDEESRARDLLYALWIPDLFMKCK